MSSAPPARLSTNAVSHFSVDHDHAGRRIDNLLVSLLGDVPKSRIYRMLRRGEVRVNGRRVRPDSRVAESDVVRLPPIRRETSSAPPGPAGAKGDYLRTRILYEDSGLLVIDKPAGMSVHGGTGLRFGLIETLRNARGGEEYLELAHRLDRDTSGCLVIARTMRALRLLHDLLREGGIDKRYLLLARGRWKGGLRTVDSPLVRNTRSGGEAVVRVDAEGKRAVTHFTMVQQFSGACLLEAGLETGRTHQIRVHAAHLGFPIAGDDKYGDPAFNLVMRRHGVQRLFLHAARIRIPMPPAATPLVIEAPLPAELQTVVQSLTTA